MAETKKARPPATEETAVVQHLDSAETQDTGRIICVKDQEKCIRSGGQPQGAYYQYAVLCFAEDETEEEAQQDGTVFQNGA